MASVNIQSLIQQEAAAQGVPAAIALAVARRESGFTQWTPSGAVLRGSAGEYGVFQLMPGTAASLGVDPTDVHGNIHGGVMYLAQLYSKYGRWDYALAAYNWGPGNLDKVIASGVPSPISQIPISAQNYINDILGVSAVYNAGMQSASASSGTSPSYTPAATYASQAGLSPQAVSLLALGGVALLVWVFS